MLQCQLRGLSQTKITTDIRNCCYPLVGHFTSSFETIHQSVIVRCPFSLHYLSRWSEDLEMMKYHSPTEEWKMCYFERIFVRLNETQPYYLLISNGTVIVECWGQTNEIQTANTFIGEEWICRWHRNGDTIWIWRNAVANRAKSIRFRLRHKLPLYLANGSKYREKKREKRNLSINNYFKPYKACERWMSDGEIHECCWSAVTRKRLVRWLVLCAFVCF